MCLFGIKKRNARKLQGCMVGGMYYALAVEKYGINASEIAKIFHATIDFYYNPENGRIRSCGRGTSKRIKNRFQKGQLEIDIEAYESWKPTITKMTLSDRTDRAQQTLEDSIKLYNERWPKN